MANDIQVTSGRDLNSYDGIAALASGPGTDALGYAKPDLSPLQTYALNKYQTNLIDYNQQQKDKKDLMDKFTDPTQHVALDENYGNQVKPLIDRQMELSKTNLQMNPNSKEWYEFHNNYNKLLDANAQLKTVQTLKQKYQDAAGASADPHEKERMLSYVDKLGNYKLGEDIPSYDKYFAYNDVHVPSGIESTGTMQRINGNKIQTVKYSINNPLGLLDKANQQSMTDPESAQTGKDIAHTLITHGGIEDLNSYSKETYNKGMVYNLAEMQKKYQPEFLKYKKENPDNSFQQFIADTGKGDELKKIYDGMDYLKTPVQYIPTDADGGRVLSGYTYSDDGKTRLNVSDNTLRAIYGANKNTPGSKEEIIKEELSKTPAEIENLKARTAKEMSDAAVNRQKANANDRLTSAKITKLKTQTSAINPLPESEIPLIGKAANLTAITEKDKSGKVIRKDYQFLIKAGDIPEDLRKKAGFAELPPKPKKADDKDGWKSYNDAVKKNQNSNYQMRFFNDNGDDITQKVSNKIISGKGKMADAINAATSNGITLKFVDKDGNIVGTTQSIDRQTLKENLKATGKGDPSLGEDLPTDTTND